MWISTWRATRRSAASCAHLDLSRVAFISNDRLQQALEQSPLTPEHIENAVQINTHARLLALKLSFFALAGLTFVGFLPVARWR